MKEVIKDGKIIYLHDDYDNLVAEAEARVAADTHVVPVFSDEELAKGVAATKQNEAHRYLTSTDWYVSRKAEAGTAIPTDILALRVQARIDANE